jgi:hypothetical protein
VAGYIEFYSRNLSEAPAHQELSMTDKLITYARLVAAKVGVGPPVHLDERVPERIVRPFADVTTIVQEFPLPNDPTQAVTIYHLSEEFGTPPSEPTKHQ